MCYRLAYNVWPQTEIALGRGLKSETYKTKISLNWGTLEDSEVEVSFLSGTFRLRV